MASVQPSTVVRVEVQVGQHVPGADEQGGAERATAQQDGHDQRRAPAPDGPPGRGRGCARAHGGCRVGTS